MDRSYSARDNDRYFIVTEEIRSMDAYELLAFREDVFNAMAKHWITPNAPPGGRVGNVRWSNDSIDGKWMHRGAAWVVHLPYGESNHYQDLRVLAGNRGYEFRAFMNNQILYTRKFTNKEAVLYFLDSQDRGAH